MQVLLILLTQAIRIGISALAGKLGVDLTGIDVGAQSEILAGTIAVIVAMLLRVYAPKLWALIKPKEEDTK
jgi:hypothetical protein